VTLGPEPVVGDAPSLEPPAGESDGDAGDGSDGDGDDDAGAAVDGTATGSGSASELVPDEHAAAIESRDAMSRGRTAIRLRAVRSSGPSPRPLER
jgi:hypothetical protein